ncbi:unnamed protein product [Phytophthora lilii]|uniref:Unnamed protein product n=1 Tax=Phytophthora lilii TaxID=2077276 RepID=A0A9W6WQM4_9STRA|nr:unnamed protein product [Phytophthora lilii]
MIRLLNVMFSDAFVARVHEIDGKPTRAELDSNQTHASSAFWTDFHTAYLSEQAESGKLNSSLTFKKCYPAIIVPHEATKLRDMWKDVSSRYTIALSNSRWLQTKPGLLETVEGKLPKWARLQTTASTEDSDSEIEDVKRSKRRKSNSPQKDTNDMISDILAALRENSASAEALEIDCRFAQLVATLNSLMTIRERMVNAPVGSYTDEDIQDVNDDIAHVRAKKKQLLRG